MNMQKIALGVGAVLGMFAVSANAATFNAVGTSSGAQSGDGTVTVTVAEFDPSWGTLDSVSFLVFSTTSNASITITNDGGSTETSSVKLNSSLTLTDTNGVIASLFPAAPYKKSADTGNVTLTGGESVGPLALATSTTEGFDFLASPSSTSAFIGTGTFDLGFVFDTGFETESGSNFTVSGSSLSNASVTVQYTYTEAPAAVPVPAALPLLGGGLALMGFVARRRRS